mgnify:CR=1 FL=1
MWHPRVFPDFLVINEIGQTSLFRDLLGELNVVFLTRYREPVHGPAAEVMTKLVADSGNGDLMDVRGFEIRTADAICQVHETCQVLARQSDGAVTTICDATGTIHKLVGMSKGDRILVIDRRGLVTDSGTPKDLERLSMQLGLDAAMLPSCTERGPPARQQSSGGAILSQSRSRWRMWSTTARARRNRA